MSSIYFSIILPTYNRASFLPKAINSVLSQKHTSWELIIIDDGSTDDTKEIVCKFINGDDRIKYFYQQNAHKSVARNNGIKKAKGDFICFLDSDDFYHETHLKCFQELILTKNKDKALYFSGVSNNVYSIEKEQYKPAINHTEFLLLNIFATPRACIKKECFSTFLFYPGLKIGQDQELWIRMVKKYPVYYHKHKTFVQVDHDSRSILGKSCYTRLIALNLIFKQSHVVRNVSNRVKNNVLSNAYFNIAKYELTTENRLKSMWYFVKSAVTLPQHEQNKLKVNCIIKLALGKKLENISVMCN